MSSPFRITDLPAELRCNIYQHVFDDMTKEPKKPWQAYHHDFVTFRGLLLANKQIYQEAKPIFDNSMSAITLYVENVPAVFDLMEAANKHQIIASASFILTFRLEHSGKHGRAEEDVLDLIRTQPGWDWQWEHLPGFFRVENFEEWMTDEGFDTSCDRETNTEMLEFPSFGNGLVLRVHQSYPSTAVVLTGTVSGLLFNHHQLSITRMRRRLTLRA